MEPEEALGKLRRLATWLNANNNREAVREREVLTALLGVADRIEDVAVSPDGFAVVLGEPSIAVKLDEPFVAVPMQRPKSSEWVRHALGYDYEAEGLSSGDVWSRVTAGLTLRVRVGSARVTFRPAREAWVSIVEEVVSQSLPRAREEVLEEALLRLAERGVTEHLYAGAQRLEIAVTADPAKAEEAVRHLLSSPIAMMWLPVTVTRGMAGPVIEPKVEELLRRVAEDVLKRSLGAYGAAVITHEACGASWWGTPSELDEVVRIGLAYRPRLTARLATPNRVVAVVRRLTVRCRGRELAVRFEGLVGVEVDALPTHPIERAVRNAVALGLMH